MNSQNGETQSSGMTLADISYVLFRHKWMILSFSVAGFLAATFVYFTKPAVYKSEAKLFINYVVDNRPMSVAAGEQVKVPDAAGANIANTEVEILRSLDVISQVVEVVGAERILGPEGGNDKELAIQAIGKSLTVEAVPRSDVLRVNYQHPDRTIVQTVLGQLIASYLKKHMAVHSAGDSLKGQLTQQAEALRSQLAETKAELKSAKEKAGVMNLEEAKRSYTEQIAMKQQEVMEAEADLAALQAAFQDLEAPTLVKPDEVVTNVSIPAEKVSEYRRVCVRLEKLRSKEQGLLGEFTESSTLVRGVRDEIALLENVQKQLEEAYPKLAAVEASLPRSNSRPNDVSTERARISALKAKLGVLNSQLAKIQAQAKVVNEMEAIITQLQSEQALKETQYFSVSTRLEQVVSEAAAEAGKVSNISVAQAPSPPVRESRKLLKLLAMIVAGGVFGGVGLAFVIELYLDRTVKRPEEIETRLRLPVLLTIPDAGRNGGVSMSALMGGRFGLLGPSNGEKQGESGALIKAGETEVAPWDTRHGLRAYYEALRYRLATYFEATNLTRKPKLVALAGCGKGAGVSSIAAGLAATLSETGDGSVLLVDMTLEQGAAHPFYRGKPGFGLEELLEKKERESALAQENLYVVSERGEGEKLRRALPSRFSHLVPKLKASDYDYIIFDMPPVNQLSVTPRLAGFMDMVLLVVESEKTDREAVKRASSLLAESKANVGVVLNKTFNYVPKLLQPEA